jgi:hypothetical protein
MTSARNRRKFMVTQEIPQLNKYALHGRGLKVSSGNCISFHSLTNEQYKHWSLHGQTFRHWLNFVRYKPFLSFVPNTFGWRLQSVHLRPIMNKSARNATSLKTDKHSVGQELLHLLRNPKIHYRIQKNPSLPWANRTHNFIKHREPYCMNVTPEYTGNS